jgi:hypothetical protein
VNHTVQLEVINVKQTKMQLKLFFVNESIAKLIGVCASFGKSDTPILKEM